MKKCVAIFFMRYHQLEIANNILTFATGVHLQHRALQPRSASRMMTMLKEQVLLLTKANETLVATNSSLIATNTEQTKKMEKQQRLITDLLSFRKRKRSTTATVCLVANKK